MTGFSMDANQPNHNHMTFNLRRDKQGYYWETESGEDTSARFNNAKDAIAGIMAMWCTGYDNLPNTALSHLLNRR